MRDVAIAADGVGSSSPHVDPSESRYPLFDTWLLLMRATSRVAAGEQQVLRDRAEGVFNALSDSAASANSSPLTTAQRTWQTLLEGWLTMPFEAQRLLAEGALELRFSARELIGHYQNERAAHQQTQAERDRLQERLERERSARRDVERERDTLHAEVKHAQSEQRRAEQLQRELTERLEKAERALADTGAAEKPAVNVVRREEDWAVVRDDAKRASGVFDTKREAVERAREIARKEGVDLKIEPPNEAAKNR